MSKYVLYHGTATKFDKLSMEGAKQTQIRGDREGCTVYGEGISLATDFKEAAGWAKDRAESDGGKPIVLKYEIEIDDSLRFGDAGEYGREMYEKLKDLMKEENYDIVKLPQEVEPHCSALFDYIVSYCWDDVDLTDNINELVAMDESGCYGFYDTREDKSKRIELVTGEYEFIFRNQKALDRLVFVKEISAE